MKQKSGYVVPVYTYLFINYLNRKQMILLFEVNEQFTVFDEPYKDSPFAFILSNKQYQIGELS